MKKARCYPLSIEFIFLILLFVMVTVFVYATFKFRDKNNSLLNVLRIIFCLFWTLLYIFGLLFNIQYLMIKENKLILRNLLFKMKTLDADQCYYEIVKLPNADVRYQPDYWICIYSIEETNLFKYGYSNGIKYKRIQLFLNDNNINFVNKYVCKGKSKFYLQQLKEKDN